MRLLLIGLSIVSMLLSACATMTTPASEQPAIPDAASIEYLLRDNLANEEHDLPGLLPHENAVLLDFRLVGLEQVSSSRWRAETELLFDFGPPTLYVDPEPPWSRESFRPT